MGPSMEFFSRGLEIGNQVYMQYDIRTGMPKELDIKVLDMGMGQERPAWFTHGTATSYEANFGAAIKKLYTATGIKPNHKVLEKFLPYSGMLNFDEVEDIDNVWKFISSKIGVGLKTLRDEVVPLAELYSVADHMRSLLVALSDGALPSNVGGGYNLRTLLRRSLDIISSNSWDVELIDVCSWHAEYLKPQYPELLGSLDEVSDILAVEEKKHQETKKKSKRIVASIKGKINLDRLITLYDSQGVTPAMLTEAGLELHIPQDFYAKVSERHQKTEAKAKTGKGPQLSLEGVVKTEILYYDDYLRLEFEAKVLKIIDDKYVVLDKTAFYPTSGGQLHDIGTINDCKVLDIFKQGSVVIHVLSSPRFKEGDSVSGKIDRKRRIQLAQHHTATHIINGVSRAFLGEHIWQAGAEKTLDKARLDITHYESLSFEQLSEIEKRANKVIQDKYQVESQILKRDMAESQFGFRLYQGGAVPGKELRIVGIDELDVEACGGTHLNNTAEAKIIKILGSTKIQDGIVRLEFTAGKAAEEYIKKIFQWTTSSLSMIIDSKILPDAPQKLGLANAKIINKILPDLEGGLFLRQLEGIESTYTELMKASRVFSVTPENLSITLGRFIAEIKGNRKKLNALGVEKFKVASLGDKKVFYNSCRILFEIRKKEEKLLYETDKLDLLKGIKISDFTVIIEEIRADAKDTLRIAKKLSGAKNIVVLFGHRERISVVAIRGEAKLHMGELVKELAGILDGRGGGRPDFGQGYGTDPSKIEGAIDFAMASVRKALEKNG
jgi:alanyl-tRNA synthetase